MFQQKIKKKERMEKKRSINNSAFKNFSAYPL